MALEFQPWREAILDLGETVVGGKVHGQPQPLTGARLYPILTHRLQEDVSRDPEQPRQRRPVVIVTEPIAAKKRSGERLCGQVARRPRKPSSQPRMHVCDMSRVQLREA